MDDYLEATGKTFEDNLINIELYKHVEIIVWMDCKDDIFKILTRSKGGKLHYYKIATQSTIVTEVTRNAWLSK